MANALNRKDGRCPILILPSKANSVASPLIEHYFKLLPPGFKRHAQIEICLRGILQLKLAKGIAERPGQLPAAGKKNHGHMGHQLFRYPPVGDLPDHHHTGRSPFMLKAQVNGVVPCLEKHTPEIWWPVRRPTGSGASQLS